MMKTNEFTYQRTDLMNNLEPPQVLLLRSMAAAEFI